MIIDQYGDIQLEETKICYPVYLHRADALTTIDDGQTVVFIEGRDDGSINVFKF